MDNDNKRIVFFIGTLCSGGAERVVSIISSQLVNKGWNVDVVTYYDRPVFYDFDIRVNIVQIEHETGSKSIPINILWLRKYIKERASIVISFLSKFNMLAILARTGLSIPIIVSERTDPRLADGSFFRFLRDLMYRKADAIVVQSDYAKHCFNKTIQKKSVVIYNPIDIGDYKGKALTTSKSKAIISVGRLIPSKNYIMLLNAFTKILESYPDYKLVIYGEGMHRHELEERAKQLGIEAKVELPGNTENIISYICDAEVFVLVSNYEGMPNALLEAMCLGLPVISTKVAGAMDVILDGENGILIDIGNETQLIKSLDELLSDKNKRETYGRKATELTEKLAVSSILSQWEEVIDSVI